MNLLVTKRSKSPVMVLSCFTLKLFYTYNFLYDSAWNTCLEKSQIMDEIGFNQSDCRNIWLSVFFVCHYACGS